MLYFTWYVHKITLHRLKTDAIIVITHSQTVNLSIVNRELVILSNMHGSYNNAFKKVWGNVIYVIFFGFIDLFAKFECSKLNKRLDCSNDCVRFHAFTPDFTCGMCIYQFKCGFKRFDFIRHSARYGKM